MGVEAGEHLENIVARKEFERRANDGVFLWGVGNSVMPAISELASSGYLPPIMFSRMKSPAKRLDEKPKRVFLWLRGETADGHAIELPQFSFITSRGETITAVGKRTHYAMFCRSSAPISLDEPAGMLCSDEIVNYRSGRSLGASQVTSVVSHNSCCTRCTDDDRYEISFAADLLPPGQIRLVDAVEIDPMIPVVLRRYILDGYFEKWKSQVREIKDIAMKSISWNGKMESMQETWAF